MYISKDGKWEYEVSDDGAATLIEPRTKDVREGSVIISNEVDGHPVTNIGNWCFGGNCMSLTNITIPDSVISLGESCFDGCTSLKSIIIPDSVTSLGDWCFSSCTSLKEIRIPVSVSYLKEWCFANCTSLQSVTMLNPGIKWETNTFEGCPNDLELYYKYW